MFRVKIISLIVMTFAIFLSSCVTGVQYPQPPDLTRIPDTDIPQQTVTIPSDIHTQTANPAILTPVPGSAPMPSASNGLKPPDSDTPAAGICGKAQGNPAPIILGNDASGMPLAGRCIVIDPAQRIKFVNQSNEALNMVFAEYQINLTIGGEILLDEPVGQYLASGVHFLPMGPELWVKADGEKVLPLATMPGLLRNYDNPEVGYKMTLPSGWNVDEYGLAMPNREVIFYPSNPEPFVSYLSISLDPRTLDQIVNSYVQNVPDAVREDSILNGLPAVQFTNPSSRHEYYIPYEDRIYLIVTDKPMDGNVQLILLSIVLTSPSD